MNVCWIQLYVYECLSQWRERRKHISLRILNLKHGRGERSSAAVRDGTVEELIGVGFITPERDFYIFIPKQHFLFTRFHVAGEGHANSAELIQTELHALHFGRFVVGVVDDGVIDFFDHKNPTFLLRQKIALTLNNYSIRNYIMSIG